MYFVLNIFISIFILYILHTTIISKILMKCFLHTTKQNNITTNNIITSTYLFIYIIINFWFIRFLLRHIPKLPIEIPEYLPSWVPTYSLFHIILFLCACSLACSFEYTNNIFFTCLKIV